MFRNINFFLPTFRQCWIIVFFIVVVGSLLALPLALLTDNPLILYVIPFVPAFVYVAVKGKYARNESEAAEIPVENCRYGSFRHTFAVALMLGIATILLIFVLEPLSSLVEIPEYLIDGLYGAILREPFWNIVSVAVAAPVIEEFFIRGIMLRGMLRQMSPAKAIVWSAFIFAVIHLNFYQALGAFTMGLFLGWIYYKSGSLLYAILIHFINNGFSAAMVLLFPDMDMETTMYEIIVQKSGVISYILLYLISVALFGIIIYRLNKMSGDAK